MVVLYATSSSEESLSKTIEEASVYQARSVMEEVDRVVHTRIANWMAFGQNPEVQEALRQSNLKFGQMTDVQRYIDEVDKAWRETPLDSTIPIIDQTQNNLLADNLRTMLKILQDAYGFPIFGEVFITNRFGANIAQTGRTSDYRQDDEAWWQDAKRDGLNVTEVDYDESARMFSTSICIRIDDKDGNLAGVIKAVLNIKEAIDIVDENLQSVEHGKDYKYLLFNSERQIIHSSKAETEFLNDGSSYFKGIRPAAHGSVFSIYRNNQDKSGTHWYLLTYAFSSGFSNYKGLGWSLVIEHDADFILRPATVLRNRILLMALASTLAALAFGSFIAVSISRRLRHLSEATIALGAGDLDRTVEVSGNDELTQCAANFNDMSAKLKDATNKLREQTTSLEKQNTLLQRSIAERKQAEEALREERDFAETLIDTAQAIVLLLDQRGRIVRFNRYMEELSGYNIEEVRGKDWFSTFLPEDNREKIVERFQQSVNGLQTKGKVNSIITKDGKRYDIEWYDATLRQSDGKMIGILAVGQDITERAMLQSQLSQAQKLEAIGQLAAGIAHEINTPIQFIGDNLQFFQEAFSAYKDLCDKYIELSGNGSGDTDSRLVEELNAAIVDADIDFFNDETPRAIEQSLDGVGRVSTIVRSMKEFSHPGKKSKELTDLNKAISNTIVVSRNEWKYVADVVTEFDSTLPLVPVVTGDFNQVMLNIIINAAHAIKEVNGESISKKGKITISTNHEDGWAKVKVMDTGAGIPKNILERIYDPFFTTKEVGKGTGQGLAIAHSVVVKKHGGTIEVQSEVGRGTSFLIRLPIERSKESSDTITEKE